MLQGTKIQTLKFVENARFVLFVLRHMLQMGTARIARSCASLTESVAAATAHTCTYTRRPGAGAGVVAQRKLW